MKLIFFNICSIGDIFYTVPFLKHLCKHNPKQEFIFHTNLASFLYKDIPNLKRLDEYDYPREHPVKLQYYEMFHQYDRAIITKIGPDTILINTWVGVLNELTAPLNCECSPQYLSIAYEKIIEQLNGMLETKLWYPPIEKKNMMFDVPEYSLDAFFEFVKLCGKETIFYFNRIGASSDTRPVTKEEEHIDVLQNLSKLYSDKYIIVPNNVLKPDCPNIIATSNFGVKEDHTCKNVLWDMEIGGRCTYAILFDIGSALTVCNKEFKNYTAKFYHCSKSKKYYSYLVEALEYCLDVEPMSIEYVPCFTPHDIVTQMRERIV